MSSSTTTRPGATQTQDIIHGMLTTLKTNVNGTTVLRGDIENTIKDPAQKAAALATSVQPLEQNTAVLGKSIKDNYDFNDRIMRVLGVG
jgi:ABC-type iron transport system FetAB ATPase subunit